MQLMPNTLCENVCLLRLQSPIDRKLAVDIWGLDDSHVFRISPIATFPPAEGLLWGHWADGVEVRFKGGQRRTKETGGDLREDWVLRR